MKHIVTTYIQDNIEHLIEIIPTEYLTEYEQHLTLNDSLFHDSIRQDLYNLVRGCLVDDIAKSTGADYETIVDVLDDTTLNLILERKI